MRKIYIIIIFLMAVSILIYNVIGVENTSPNMYISATEIQAIKNKVDLGQQPWKSAYDSMISDANVALGTSSQSVTYGGKTPPSGDVHDYYSESPYISDGVFDPNADRTDYTSAITVGHSVRDLGLAYAFTGESRYADKAVQIISIWSTNPATRMNPKFTSFNGQSYIELGITMPGMYYGADLIWDYPGWNSVDKETFKEWTRQLSVSLGRDKEANPQNYENWKVLFVSSSAVVTGDTNDMDWAFQYWKELIPKQMDAQGRMINELSRTRSLFYSLYAINAMTQTAEIARHNGVDLYNYATDDGRGLELAYDYHAPYAENPSSWPYEEISPDMVEYGVFELAHSFKQKSSYEGVINRVGRPMYESRIMGPVTLTHANTDFGTVPTPVVTPTVTPVTTPGITPGITPGVGPTPPPSVGQSILVYCYKIVKGTIVSPIPTPITPGPTPIPTPITPGPTPIPTPITPGPTPIPTPITPGEETGMSTPGGYLEYKNVTIHNNVWGLTDSEKSDSNVKTYIYYKSNGNLGWEWNRPDPRPNPNIYIPPLYQEVIVGEIPAFGSGSSLVPYFPVQSKNINSWTSEVEYQYVIPATDSYNLAYDIYWMDPSNLENKKFNVMIWPYGRLTGDLPLAYVSDGINEYEYHYRAPTGDQYWPWHAFILRDQSSPQTYNKVNIKALLDQLPAGSIDGNWIVPGIELGNEVWRGSGRIEISKLLVNINGNEIRNN